ncbi:MAG: hypothetical protein ACRDTD_31020 [Pseudonocardiaceae bacterium]
MSTPTTVVTRIPRSTPTHRTASPAGLISPEGITTRIAAVFTEDPPPPRATSR